MGRGKERYRDREREGRGLEEREEGERNGELPLQKREDNREELAWRGGGD